MWDLIVSVPDHCLSFYFIKQPILLTELSGHTSFIVGLGCCSPPSVHNPSHQTFKTHASRLKVT